MQKYFLFGLRFLVLFVVSSASVFPIITRHDVKDAEFFKLGNKFRDSICNLNVNPKVPDCMATFLNDRWILTAAHCAVIVDAKLKKGSVHEIEFRGELFEVEKVVVHPDYVNTRSVQDIALIKLKRSPHHIKTIAIFNGALEMREPIIVAGYGDIGNGKTGPTGNDRKLRGGTNSISSMDQNWIRFIFDDPGSPNVTPLEGISGPGDSGGPVFIERGGKYYLIGISSRQSTRATGGREGLYGVTEFYTRVSTYENWISETLDSQRSPCQ